MISSRGKRLMNGPSMRSNVAATAMPRTRDAPSAKNLSRSFGSGSLSSSNTGFNPPTMTGLSGPISSTAVFSAAISHSRNWRSYQHRHRLLDNALEGRQQLRPDGAVDHAVIARKRHRDDADEGDAAVRALHRLAPRGADCEDGRLRRIDDGGKLAHPVHAEIGDCGRAALIFARIKLPRTCPRDQILHLVRYRGKALGLGSPDDGRDQSAFDGDCNADVAMTQAQDAVARPDRVRVRHLNERCRPGFDEEVVDRELESL